MSNKIDDLHKIAKALLTYETLTGEEIENIMNLEVSIDAFNVEAAFLVRNPELSLHQISSQEIQVGDNPIQYDGGASNPDNRQHSEQAGK